MKRSSYWGCIGGTLLSLLFLKIYLHNRHIKVSYRLQALREKQTTLQNKHDKLLARLHQRKEPALVMKHAKQKLGMQPLMPKQIVHLTDDTL